MQLDFILYTVLQNILLASKKNDSTVDYNSFSTAVYHMYQCRDYENPLCSEGATFLYLNVCIATSFSIF